MWRARFFVLVLVLCAMPRPPIMGIMAALMATFFVDPLNTAMADQRFLSAAALAASGRDKLKTHFWDNASGLSDKQFKSFFRVPKAVFNTILSRISTSDYFITSPNVGARATTVDRQLAVFLLRAAGETCSKIATLMDVSQSTVVTSTERVCLAIIECFPDAVRFAVVGEEKKRDMDGFAAKGFEGARCVIDVCKFEVTVEAAVTRAGLRHAFADRHHRIVQSYQFAVNCDYRILDIEGGQGGPVSDVTIFYNSKLYQHVQRNLKKDEYYMADMGYPLREYCVSGYKKPEIDAAESGAKADAMRFLNRRFSGVRNVVERVFSRSPGYCAASAQSPKRSIGPSPSACGWPSARERQRGRSPAAPPPSPASPPPSFQHFC